MSSPGTSEKPMNVFIKGRLLCQGIFYLFLFAVLSLLLPGMPVMHADAAESTSQKTSGNVLDGADDTPRDSSVIFEEFPPGTNGNAPADSLPEPDDCLGSSTREVQPKIAIIIDDMGHHHTIGVELLGLDLNLSFSFLPYAPFTEEQEEHAWKMGRDILVHMPMEPRDAIWDPGEGALYVNEPADQTVQAVRDEINRVPHAIGVNNHMGSLFTSDRQAMHSVLSVVKERGLFFVDSVTDPETVGADEARKMGIRTGSRIVFLDNVHTSEDICRQLKRLVAYAKKHGSGIAIGHPNRATLDALMRCKDMLTKQVDVVGVHELVR